VNSVMNFQVPYERGVFDHQNNHQFLRDNLHGVNLIIQKGNKVDMGTSKD
jgi:hypothetical protein